MAMLVFGFICLSFLARAEIAAGQDDCLPARCGNGPEIRSPFWLKGHQTDRCGNTTVMELQYPVTASTNNIVIPLRVKLGINDIDYKSQVLSSDRMNVPDCLPRQLPHVNSPASPFGVVSVFSTGGGFSLFNCSTSANNGSDSRNGWPIPCLSTPDFQVRYLDSGFGIPDFPLSSCAKMYSISYVPSAVFTGQEQYDQTYNYIRLNWSKPSRANCETNGKHCRLRYVFVTNLSRIS